MIDFYIALMVWALTLLLVYVIAWRKGRHDRIMEEVNRKLDEANAVVRRMHNVTSQTERKVDELRGPPFAL